MKGKTMATTIFDNNLNENSTNLIINELRKGSVGIFPTDTVYGIGCDALNLKALEKLYKLTDIFPEHEEAQEMIRRLS